MKVKISMKTILIMVILTATPMYLFAITSNSLIISNTLTFATYTVDILGVSGANSYSPATITINSGDTIVWRNLDFTTHSATCGTGTPCGMWDTGEFTGTSAPIPYTSFAGGTTHYFCTLHGDGQFGMYGAVIRLGVNVQDWEKMGSNQIKENENKPMVKGPYRIVFVPPSNQTRLELKPKDISSVIVKE